MASLNMRNREEIKAIVQDIYGKGSSNPNRNENAQAQNSLINEVLCSTDNIVQLNLFKFLPEEYQKCIGKPKADSKQYPEPDAKMIKTIAKFLILQNKGYHIYKKIPVFCELTQTAVYILKDIIDDQGYYKAKQKKSVFNLRSIFKPQERQKVIDRSLFQKHIKPEYRIAFEKEIDEAYSSE